MNTSPNELSDKQKKIIYEMIRVKMNDQLTLMKNNEKKRKKIFVILGLISILVTVSVIVI